MFMRAGPPVDDEAQAFAVNAQESTEGWSLFYLGPLSVMHYNWLREAIPQSLHDGMLRKKKSRAPPAAPPERGTRRGPPGTAALRASARSLAEPGTGPDPLAVQCCHEHAG